MVTKHIYFRIINAFPVHKSYWNKFVTAEFFPVSIYTNFVIFIGYGYHNSVLIFKNLNLNRLTLLLWEDLSLLITGG